MFQNSIQQHLSCCFSLDFLTLIHFVNHSSFFKLDTELWGQIPIVVAIYICNLLFIGKFYTSGLLFLRISVMLFSLLCIFNKKPKYPAYAIFTK